MERSGDRDGGMDRDYDRYLRFDPNRLKDCLDDLENVFDGTKAGRYDCGSAGLKSHIS